MPNCRRDVEHMINRLSAARIPMKYALVATIAALLVSSPAHAIGCITGGAAGAVAGHVVHHGVVGAIGGCIAGHELHKRQLQQQRLQQQQNYPVQQQ